MGIDSITSTGGAKLSPQLLTRSELAQALKISVSETYNLQNAKVIPCIRVTSRLIRFDWEAVMEALEGRTLQSVGEVAA